MSRSNPSTHIPNPAVRFYEWDGSNGEIRYYDKTTKKNVPCGSDFGFLVLDELSAVKGFHDPSNSNIFSNEVRDTRSEVFVVKAKKGGITICSGLYAVIKDKVNASGGGYAASIYIAYKSANGLEIGHLTLKGAALSTWMEFTKDNRGKLYEKAVRIKGFTEHVKGKITYRCPKLYLMDTAPETDKEAKDCDIRLQAYLKAYFARTKSDQAAPPPDSEGEDDPQNYPDPNDPSMKDTPTNRKKDEEPEPDDVPF